MPRFENRREIKAPLEWIWSVMTNPHLWPKWFPGIKEVPYVSGVKRDSTFEWRDNKGRTGYGAIMRADLNKRLEIATQMGGDADLHIFELKSRRSWLRPGSSRNSWVEYTLDTFRGDGILTGASVDGSSQDTLWVKNALERLKKIIEDQAR
jgi:uncharacterized protein YndB with AHSA1/START domain